MESFVASYIDPLNAPNFAIDVNGNDDVLVAVRFNVSAVGDDSFGDNVWVIVGRVWILPKAGRTLYGLRRASLYLLPHAALV